MQIHPPASKRPFHQEILEPDLCIVGGGLAGTCAAITAARAGLKVALMQDRPVLGGNASSEVRLWILGATSHMGNNNRWAIEGGVVHEILCENLWRNPSGNPVLIDSLLLEKVIEEPNIRLLLNTAAVELEKSDADTISAVHGFNSQNSTRYLVSAPLFVDASGDGVLGFLSGAAFRIGAESREEFGEPYAPEKPSTELLGHSLYLMSKDVGYPVPYVAPSFALGMKEVGKIHRYRSFDVKTQACQFWWMEYGGRLDTVHATEEIKWELWRAAYGVWDYIKNSGKYPEAETMTLEWVGHIPGKRESRRFEGDVMLRQQDIVEQREWPDAVSFGGWAIDHHPADGMFSEHPGCTQWHARGVYAIPYRTMYSRNIRNLFLAGRIISASHIAFGSTRVMATCAHNAQAVAIAAKHCLEGDLLPRDLNEPDRMRRLQRDLLRTGQYIPGVALEDEEDLAQQAEITASSEFTLGELPPNGETQPLDFSRAMMLPVQPGSMSAVTVRLDVEEATTLRTELRISSKPANHTPDSTLSTEEISLEPGPNQAVTLRFDATVEQARYSFICLMRNPHVRVRLSDRRVTGVLALANRFAGAVATNARQSPPEGIGIENFEFWLPDRRPAGKNWALRVDPPLACFGPGNIINGVTRPVSQPNAWVADFSDPSPTLALHWEEPQQISRIIITLDCDYDNPLESVIWGHNERVAPFCVKHLRILDETDKILHEIKDNHAPRIEITQHNSPQKVQNLKLEVLETHGAPAAIFSIQAFS